MDAQRVPVILGVGQVADRAVPHADGPSPVDLAADAVLRALADASAVPTDAVDWLGVVGQIGFRDITDMPALLCERLGMRPAHSTQSEPTGDSPVRLLNEAANAIGRGEAQVAVIAGAEALRTAARRTTGALFGKTPEGDSSLRQRYGLRAPAAFYSFYEQATRAAWGQSAAEAQAESAALWAGMAQVASGVETAWLRTAPDAGTIAQVSADNRLVAYPYPKLMVANASVNQGAALVVASLAFARAHGISHERIIHIGAGAAAHESDDPLLREAYDRSIGMEATLCGVLDRNGLTIADIDHVELYSCFPVVPKMARRILDWPMDRPISCFGGLTFGGGPIANYMTHAIASMVDRLRAERGVGLLFGNGGYASHHHAIILSTTLSTAQLFPQDFSCQAEATAQRGLTPTIDDDREGPATIETYTLFYARDGSPDYGALLARRADGTRLIARIDGTDTALVALLTNGTHEPVGMTGTTFYGDDGLLRWRISQ